MIKKLILLSLTVGQILASPFVEKGKRAELFEIMDREVPSFKVTVPDEKFELLKQSMQTIPVDIGAFNETIEEPLGNSLQPQFEKIKDATMVVEIDDTVKEFSKVSFDIGGSSARAYGRQGFNLKIRDKNNDLYGRRQFRIRSDPRDATLIRSKLACDMLNRLGLISISANYIKLYVNEEYFGFYVLMDAPKIPWVEEVFGEKDTKHLYKCKVGGGYLTNTFGFDACENEDEEYTDKSEFTELIEKIDNAKSVKEIEDIFDVDQFLYIAAYDYLSGAWDHFFHSGHNYVMYKNKDNGKWTIIYYDFDSDLGQDASSIDSFNPAAIPDKNYEHYNVRQWLHFYHPISKLAIWDNFPEFESKLKDFVIQAFNPALLFPHIDEIKDFIRPYILYDKTPGENGINPGILNLANPSDYTFAQWEANSEFTNINDPNVHSEAYGLKYWILERYRTVCKDYHLECDPVYMDENYKYQIDKEVEGEFDIHKYDGIDWNLLFGNNRPPITPTETAPVALPAETSTVVSPSETSTVTLPAETSTTTTSNVTSPVETVSINDPNVKQIKKIQKNKCLVKKNKKN